MEVLESLSRFVLIGLVAGVSLLAVACGRVDPAPETRGPALALLMEEVELRAYLGDRPQFVFYAARMWLDEVEGRLRVEEVHGQLEPICFEEARP